MGEFHEKINKIFEDILKDKEQVVFISDEDGNSLEMNYSRVFYNCMFDIFKKNKDTGVICEIESDKFNAISKEGKGLISFCVYKEEFMVPLKLDKEQYLRLYIDSYGNLYKMDLRSGKLIQADKGEFVAVIQ